MATLVTKTVKSAGGDYTTLAAAEAGMQANFVTLDVVKRIECYAMTDTATATFFGATTDITRRWEIVGIDRHAGAWAASGVYSMSINAGNGINCFNNYVYAEGIQIEVLAGASVLSCFLNSSNSASNQFRIHGCIARSNPSSALAGNLNGFQSQNTVAVLLATACVASGFNHNGGSVGVNCNPGTLRFYNGTIYGCDKGVQSGSSTGCTTKNTLIANCADAYSNAGAGAQAGDYNAISNASDANMPGSNSRAGVTFTFVNAAGDDFHLDPSDVGAQSLGTDLSADADLPFTLDIDNETIAAPWPCGADWVAVAADEGQAARFQSHLTPYHFQTFGMRTR